MMRERRSKLPLLFLAAALLFSLACKLAVIKVGGPWVSIDDRTTFDGGFLAWFGQAPPQRMYLECWIAGVLSVGNYAFRVLSHAVPGTIGLNIVADAYGDYYRNPDTYAHVYRAFVLLLDLAAAGLTWRLARRVFGDLGRGWAAVLPPAMFLLTYNTVWADIVARPDAMLPLFMTAGLLMYYRSDFGRQQGWLLGAGFVLGLGAGLKLHLALAVLLLLGDLIRVHGLRQAIRMGWAFAALSLLAFLVSAGIPLFDPLKYVKLRVTNAKDDASPWIKWGHEFITMLRGAGWVVLPLTVGAMLQRGVGSFRRLNPVAASLVFQSIGWLLLFSAIRQLRAYWMLPALPLFYIAAVGFLACAVRERQRWLRPAVVVAAVAIVSLSVQSVLEVGRFRAADQNGLRAWIRSNVARTDPFFVFGFEGLVLPRSTQALATIAAGIERGIAADRASGQSFTARHVKNWEEEVELARQDFLGRRCDDGWEFYSYHTTPFDKYQGLVDMEAMRYIMVEEHFENPPDYPLAAYLAEHFDLVAETVGAGGEGYGLHYRIYGRRVGGGS
jgi:hypothetical protein